MVGFDCGNKHEINKEYICATCELVLRNPFQLECGHRFCELCISQDSDSITCFTCLEVTPKDKSCLDRGVMNDMKTMKITCKCGSVGDFKDYQKHLDYHASLISNDGISPTTNEIGINNKTTLGDVPKLETSEKKSPSENCTVQTSIEKKCELKDKYIEKHDTLVSYDNGCLWRINGIGNILNDKTFAITSRMFYTNSSGYKVCLRLHSNDDDTEQPTHISISLFLVPGEYDSILVWPFQCAIVFAFHNVKNQKDHIVGSILSKTKIQSPMNLAGEIPKFISLSMIQQQDSPYISDDTLFVKMLIMKDSIPKSILPSIMRIDNGLPLHIQQEEVEKQMTEYEKNRSYKLILVLKSK